MVAFAASGRSSHAEDLTVAGIAGTAWPFLAGLALAWLASRNWRAPLRLWPNGVLIWIITVVAGLILRVASGTTAALPFILVATAVLGAFLLGHRALALLVLRLRRRATQSSAHPPVG